MCESAGATYLNSVMNRRQPNRHRLAILALTFILRAYELANRTPDAAYNVGRAFHQLDLCYLAIPYYQKALEPLPGQPPATFRREAAFNLSLIYRKAGAHEAARRIMAKYLEF